MATLYPGFDTFTPSAQPSTFGRWITGYAADDGDLDDAAHLMNLAICAIDKINFLGHRMIDIVTGGTYTFTASISIRNNFTFTGYCRVDGISAQWHFRAPTYLEDGATFHIGSVTLGPGQVEVIRGSKMLIDGTTGASGFAKVDWDGAYAQANFTNGAKLNFDYNSFAELYGVNGLGDSTGAGHTTLRHPFIKSGTKARTETRVRYLTTSDFEFDTIDHPGEWRVKITASEADLWVLPNNLATLSPPPPAPGSGAVALDIENESVPFEFTITTSGNPDAEVQVLSAQGVGCMGRFMAVAGPIGITGSRALANIKYHRGTGTLFVKDFLDLGAYLGGTAQLNMAF